MLNTPPVSFNRRRDACFPATSGGCTSASQYAGFQSQTRRLLPRNSRPFALSAYFLWFQSQTRRLLPRNRASAEGGGNRLRFNRRRDACFPATSFWVTSPVNIYGVSIADATLASPQHPQASGKRLRIYRFNRRRDACFPATVLLPSQASEMSTFQSQTRRLLPRNLLFIRCERDNPYRFNRRRDACFPATSPVVMSTYRRFVSIADATLASPQQYILN